MERKSPPVAIPRMPPSRFCKAVYGCQHEGPCDLSRNCGSGHVFCGGSISFVQPPGPGELPEGAVWRHLANNLASNCKADCVSKSSTSCGKKTLPLLWPSLPQLIQSCQILWRQRHPCEFVSCSGDLASLNTRRAPAFLFIATLLLR